MEQPRQDKIQLYRHDVPKELTNPFHMYSKSPICLSFNSQQGPPLSDLSGSYSAVQEVKTTNTLQLVHESQILIIVSRSLLRSR
jgi:hypothetical protein